MERALPLISRWLFLLVIPALFAGCSDSGAGPDAGPGDGDLDGADADPCFNPEGRDRDCDGLPDAIEDKNGNGIVDPGETDPLDPDSDGDGILDGDEDSNHNGTVDPGETDPTLTDTDGDGFTDSQEDPNGNGIVDPNETDPTNPDTDGDGMLDGDEDHGGDGILGECTTPCTDDSQCQPGEVCTSRLLVCYSYGCAQGESDPLNPDTDGDGILDGDEASVLVCSAEALKVVNYHTSVDADFKLALELFFSVTSPLLASGEECGIMFYDPGDEIAGFLLSRDPVANSAAGQETEDREAIGLVTTLGTAITRGLTTFDGFDAVIADYHLTIGSQTTSEFGNLLVGSLASGMSLSGLLPAAGASASEFRLSAETVYRSGTQVLVLGALSPADLLDDPQIIRMNDVTNSTALAAHLDQIDNQCDSFLSVGDDPVDFIWVVDNSSSMEQEQAAVALAGDTMGALLSTTTLDWRLAVTNTDNINQGRLTSGFVTDIDQFKSDIVQGIDGSPKELSLEMGLAAIDNSLPCTPDDQPADPYRLRCKATRIVIILSDEDDDAIEEISGGDNYPGDPNPGKVEQFARAYIDRDAILFAIVGGNPRCPNAMNASKGINAVVEAVGGGSVGSICDADQTANIEAIIRATSGVSSTYNLSQPAISSTIKVAIVLSPDQPPVEVPRSRTDGFDYDGVTNAILFYGSFRPTINGLDVVASYRYFIDTESKD